MLKKIVSGGQTGVDRAGLDVAIALGIEHGGWCPRGRKAEDGIIPEKYVLKETISDDYSERTKANIRDSDGTLILVPALPLKITDGTLLTIQEVKDKEKLFFVVDLSIENDIDSILSWLYTNSIKTLNIAGPRESQSDGINQRAFKFLYLILSTLNLRSNVGLYEPHAYDASIPFRPLGR